MANRSYLYSTGQDKVLGISERDYDIPLTYKILVSQDAKIARSIIWDDSGPIAVQGDFVKGRQRLYDFLDALIKEDIFNESELAGHIANAKTFLDSPDNAGAFFHLENGEIYEMADEDEELEAQNRAFFENEILKIDDTIEAALAGLRESKKNNDLKGMWELLGIGYWSNTLYYDFSGELGEPDDLDESDEEKEEKEAARRNECRYCWNALSLKTWECKFCGKGGIGVCNKCGGKIGMLSSKCNICNKSYKECFYCGGKMKMDFDLTDLVCQSCDRVRKY